MYKEVPEDLMAKIKEAAGTINEHNCAVDTMLIAVGEKYYGYQPQPQPKKKKYCQVADKRLEELSHTFNEVHDGLAKEDIELLVCFVALKDGGATVFVSQEAVNRRLDVFNELKKMEEQYAKIS
jgi:hypothetical protein